MRTYELSLTTSYVSDWDFPMAIRELIQNGVDQEAVDHHNKFSIEYRDGSIWFKNPKSRLKINTLLLGRSTKRNDENTVGQFGEGYKIAALVLNRMGKSFTVHNYQKKEIWTTRFVNSRRWHDKILVFDVEEKHEEGIGLAVEVGNVTKEEYESLQSAWLGFLLNYEHVDTDYGQILLDKEQKNHIYVNGLFISCNAEMEYGYNFKPQYLQLERDRKSCDSWDARTLTSKMIDQAFAKGELDTSAIVQMIDDGKDDVSCVGFQATEPLSQSYMEAFDEKYANDKKIVVPVSTQRDHEKVTACGGQAVYVSYNAARLVEDTSRKRMQALEKEFLSTPLTLKEEFEHWLMMYREQLDMEAKEALEILIDKL